MHRDEGEAGIGLATGAAIMAIAMAVASGTVRSLAMSEARTNFVVFFGGATIALAAVASSVRSPMPGRVSIFGVAWSIVVIALVFGLHRRGVAPSIAVDVALVVFAVAVGAAIGTRIEHVGHLLPAGFIAAAADVSSVASPEGLTHKILESDWSLSFLAVSFPTPNTPTFSPVLGVGDLLFVALVLGAVR
ncbi:MAG: hypothetical protein ACHREM_33555, partial [Polyangiales bacterium]